MTKDNLLVYDFFGHNCKYHKETRMAIKLFLKFLIKVGAYSIYIRNMTHERNAEWITKHHPIDDCYDYINDAFLWEITPEGHSYWESLHNEWRELWGEFSTRK